MVKHIKSHCGTDIKLLVQKLTVRTFLQLSRGHRDKGYHFTLTYSCTSEHLIFNHGYTIDEGLTATCDAHNVRISSSMDM